MADCYCNVVFDGLESVFTPNLTCSASVVLKAFNNRKYIFLVTLRASLSDLKDRENAAQKQKRMSLLFLGSLIKNLFRCQLSEGINVLSCISP